MDVIGVIPAAGLGERLSPYSIEKEMFPIGFYHGKPKPVSQYLIERMIKSGIRKIFMIINSNKSNLIKYYQSGKWLGISIAYIYQDKPRGMGDALCGLIPWIRNEIVVMGMPDTIFEPTDAFSRLIDFYIDTNSDLVLGLFPVSDPSKYGVVLIDDEYNVIYHVDKPAFSTSHWCWGIACWGERFSEFINHVCGLYRNHHEEFTFGNIIDMSLKEGLSIKGLPFHDGRYIDVGTMMGIVEALQLYGQICKEVASND